MPVIDTRPDVDENSPDEPYNRPRGVLTPDDREFLLEGKEDLSQQSKRDTRYRIRERVKNAIWDFHILLYLQDQRDREQIFQEFHHNPEYLEDMLSYVYQGITDHSTSLEDSWEEFGLLAEKAVRTGLNQRDQLIENIDVSIQVEANQPDKEDILGKIERKEDDPNEIMYLFQQGNLTQSERRKVQIRMMEHVTEGNMDIRFEKVDDKGEREVEKLGPDKAQAVLDNFHEEDNDLKE